MTVDEGDGHKDVRPARLMCDALDVSPAGYYAWRGRPPSFAEQRRGALLVLIRGIRADGKGRYGSPRAHAQLAARGHERSVNTVAKLMRDNDIRAETARKFRRRADPNHALPVADDVLDRQFGPEAPSERWVADVTYVPTREGWLYLAVVEGLYSRMVVGWSMGGTTTSRLVVDALGMAVRRRRPDEGLVAHSDRGSQYASDHHQLLLGRYGIECSMSGKGQCRDNAPMGPFFASLKKELAHDAGFATRGEARAAVFEYTEAFYDNQRLHPSLGYVSPAAHEQPG